jgi:hypothetical protein
LDLDRIVRELEEERDRITQAINLLRGANSSFARRGTTAGAASSRPRQGGMTAAGRKRLSELMKKRWAERRKRL